MKAEKKKRERENEMETRALDGRCTTGLFAFSGAHELE